MGGERRSDDSISSDEILDALALGVVRGNVGPAGRSQKRWEAYGPRSERQGVQCDCLKGCCRTDVASVRTSAHGDMVM